jgi:hypothetical protein
VLLSLIVRNLFQMGNICKSSKDVKIEISSDEDFNMKTSESEYKAKLEQKLCLFKETPEPICDLSDCNLEKLPSLFPMVKVLRKEILILKQNRLKSLATGGSLKDLELLHVLDISHNCFKVIPLEISVLINLRVSHQKHFFNGNFVFL